MRCGNCGVDNPSTHKFCANCGHQLTRVCPVCQTRNDPQNRFCSNCGSPLADHAPSAPLEQPAATADSGELRLVSVLFADLVGYTTFSEGRDPEDVRSMLTRYYDSCREIIARYGGVTDKFIGDAVMGVWGADRAMEDDAERAVRAALELVDMVSGLGRDLGIEDLAARAGVLSGGASVGSGGNEHGLVVGDLVNTASRLQSIAPPGGVFVGQTTRDLVGAAIEFEVVGDQMVKGKEIPVTVYLAKRVLSLSTAHGGGDLGDGPFVGRDDELRLLKDQLNATGREGRARMVTIVGEAGIGKTRLSQELVRYIDGITDDVYYHRGRSPSYGDGVTFWALGEMIRERAGILEGDDDAKARLKLRTVVAEFAPDESDQRWIEPRLAGLLGLATMPSGDRDEMFAALRTFFQRISALGTVLMVFEDVHWADEGLLDFVSELVERSSQHPILVICLARPELYDRHPEWGVGRRRSLSMDLAPLHAGAMEDLVRGLAPGLPDELVVRIAARSAGIPLHAVEFVRMLVNSGDLAPSDDGLRLVGEVGDLAVPDSLNAIIGARLDRLTSDAASVVQDAAVLGQSFKVSELANLRGVSVGELERPLSDLVAREVLELDTDPRSPERGQFRFVQGLIQEVAYGRMSKTDRVSRHLEIAESWEAEADPERAAIIASHYYSAAAADPNNEELAERTRNAVVAAADRAASLFSDAQAVGFYQQAIAMTNDPSETASLQLRAANSLDASGRTDEGLALVGEARKWFESVGDVTGTAEAAVMEAEIHSSGFDADAMVASILPLYESIEPTEDLVWARLAAQTARALMVSGRMEEAYRIADQAVPIFYRLGEVEATLDALVTRGSAVVKDRWYESVVVLRGVIDVSKELDLASLNWRALNNYAATVESDSLRPEGEIREMISQSADRSGRYPVIVQDRMFVSIERLGEGNFKDAIEILDALLADDAPSVMRTDVELQRLMIVGVRDGWTEESRQRIAELSASLLSEEGAWNLSTISGQQVTTTLWVLGEYEEAVALALHQARFLGSTFPYFVMFGLVAAAFSRDSDATNVLADRLQDLPPGRANVALAGYARSFASALKDDVEAAVTEFTAADEVADDVFDFMNLALMRAVGARVIGTDSPVMAEAADRALKFFDDCGAILYQERFSALRGDEAVEDIAG